MIRQMQHSLSRGIDWLFFVSDDSDFSDVLRKEREEKFVTEGAGDWEGALRWLADLWVPWAGVEVTEKDLVP